MQVWFFFGIDFHLVKAKFQLTKYISINPITKKNEKVSSQKEKKQKKKIEIKKK